MTENSAPAAPVQQPVMAPKGRSGRASLGIALLAGIGVGVLTQHGTIQVSNPLEDWGLMMLGLLLGLQATALARLLLGRLGGTAAALLLAGTGPLVAVLRIGRTGLALRAIPLTPLQSVGPLVPVPALRLRVFCCGLARVLAPLALGLALSWPGRPVLSTMGTGSCLMAALLLVGSPRTVGTPSWMLFRAPFADAPLLPGLTMSEPALGVQRALVAGRIAEARAGLAEVPQRSLAEVRIHAAMALVDGRNAEAVEALRGERAQRGLAAQTPGAEILLARAGLLALEDGSMPREDAQAAVRIGSSLAAERMPRVLRLSDVPATEALLSGRAPEAVKLARRTLRAPTDVLTHAYTLCTLAGALALSGEPVKARRALARAQALAPGLARIDTVDRLIGELPG